MIISLNIYLNILRKLQPGQFLKNSYHNELLLFQNLFITFNNFAIVKKINNHVRNKEILMYNKCPNIKAIFSRQNDEGWGREGGEGRGKEKEVGEREFLREAIIFSLLVNSLFIVKSTLSNKDL